MAKKDMFKVVVTGKETSVEVEHNNEVLHFQIDSILNKKLQERIEQSTFETLNRYLDYKGDEFKQKLFDTLAESKNDIYRQLGVKDLTVLPLHIVHNVLDLFDINDVHDFIIKTNITPAPDMLKDVFDKTIIQNDEGSREQTYLKSDYYWLIALITILRSTFGILGEFAAVKSGVMPENYKEYILLNFYRTHPIYETPPFKKLRDYIGKLVEVAFLNEEESAIRIIELKINREELAEFILGLTLIQRLLIVSEHNSVDDRNIITKMYHFVKARIKLKGTPSNSDLRMKRHIINDDDTESKLETFRVGTDIPPGIVEEFKYVYGNVSNLIKWMGIKNPDMVYKIIPDLRNMKDHIIPTEIIYLTAIALKNIIDPRTVFYIPIDDLVNGIATVAAWCFENGHIDIGLILSSISKEETLHSLNMSVKSKMSDDIKEKLFELYPYHKAIKQQTGDVKYVPFIETYVNNLAIELMRKNFVNILPIDVLEYVSGSKDRTVIIPEDIRDKIGKFLIDVELKTK